MENNNKKATTSLTLGIISLIAWLLPLAGYPVSVIGLIIGIIGLNSEEKNKAMTGLILSIVGLALCVANSAIGAYMGANGQLF